jgi:hypothetical protein
MKRKKNSNACEKNQEFSKSPMACKKNLEFSKNIYIIFGKFNYLELNL